MPEGQNDSGSVTHGDKGVVADGVLDDDGGLDSTVMGRQFGGATFTRGSGLDSTQFATEIPGELIPYRSPLSTGPTG